MPHPGAVLSFNPQTAAAGAIADRAYSAGRGAGRCRGAGDRTCGSGGRGLLSFLARDFDRKRKPGSDRAGRNPSRGFRRVWRQLPYALKLHPRIEDYGVIPMTRKRTVPIVGMDLIAEGALEGVAAEGQSRTSSDLRLNESVWLSSGLGYKSGDRVRLLINDTGFGLYRSRRAGRAGRRSDCDGSRAGHANAPARRKARPDFD